MAHEFVYCLWICVWFSSFFNLILWIVVTTTLVEAECYCFVLLISNILRKDVHGVQVNWKLRYGFFFLKEMATIMQGLAQVVLG